MSESKGYKNTFLIGMIILFSQVILIASIVSGELLESVASDEIEMMNSVYGSEITTHYLSKANKLTNEMMIDSGVEDSIRKFLIPKSYLNNESEFVFKDDASFFWKHVDASVSNLTGAVNFTLLRIVGFSSWLALFVLLTGGALISGYLQREIKKEGFEYSSPMRHGIAKKIIFTLPITVYIIVVLPIAIHPIIYPALVAVIAMFAGWYISNTIKRV